MKSAQSKKCSSPKINDKEIKSLKELLKNKKPVFKFFGIILGVISAYYLIAFLFNDLFNIYIKITASIAAFVLNALGTDAVSNGQAIVTNDFILSLSFGCEGTEPIVIFIAGVIAFPAKWKPKLLGLVGGTILLYLLNFIRIIALYYIGRGSADTFETFHVAVFPVLFIFISIIVFYLWLKLSTKPETKVTENQA
jgi:exosortase/archaeosortase family protein